MNARKWRDLRLLAGSIFILTAVIIGWQLVRGLSDRDTYWVATRDLTPGEQLVVGDLVQTEALLDGLSSKYWEGTTAPVGFFVERPIGAGELMPAGALAESLSSEVRYVTVGVELDHAPLNMVRGSIVDLWATTEETSEPTLVLPSILVSEVAAQDTRLGAFTATRVSLLIAPSQVSTVVAAIRKYSIDLVLHGFSKASESSS